MAPNYQIVPFHQNAPAPAGDLAFLHEQLLPRSPVVKLGREFMEKCYYPLLSQEGLIFGYVAYIDGVPAGFTCGTERSSDFLNRALRRHFPSITISVLRSILNSPKRLAALWEGYRVMSSRAGDLLRKDEAELLTTGVLPAYLSRSFFKETRLRIAEDLLLSIMKDFAKRRVPRVCTIIDEDNGLSRSFVHRHGWNLDSVDVPGWKHKSVSYVWVPTGESLEETSVGEVELTVGNGKAGVA